MESFPCCLLGCCAVGVGDAEGRWWVRGIAASEGEEVLRVGYECVLSGDAFVDEDGAVLGFVWACEDCGDGASYGWCSGDAEWDVASVDDCG